MQDTCLYLYVYRGHECAERKQMIHSQKLVQAGGQPTRMLKNMC